MTWPEILEHPEWSKLTAPEQVQARSEWVDAYVVPEWKKAGISDRDINGLRSEANQTWDNGIGMVSSFGSSAAQGFLNTGTAAVQGAGVLLGDEELEESGRGMQQAVNETFPTNPVRENTNLAGQVVGNVGAFLLTGGAGGAAGKTVGLARGLTGDALSAVAQTGAKIGSLGTGFAAGAGGGAQAADQYGITGEDRYLRALLGGGIEAGSELLGGFAPELTVLSRIRGLRELSPARAASFVRSVGTEAGEEIAAEIGGNLATTALAPPGVQTPDALHGTVQAGIGGALGGGIFGAVNLIGSRPQSLPPLPPIPPPSEQIARSAEQAAMAAGDPAAAAVIRDVQPPMQTGAPSMTPVPNPLDALEARAMPVEDATLGEEFAPPDATIPAELPQQEEVPVSPVTQEAQLPTIPADAPFYINNTGALPIQESQLPELPGDAPFLINNNPPITSPTEVEAEQPLPTPEEVAAQPATEQFPAIPEQRQPEAMEAGPAPSAETPAVVDQSLTPGPQASGDDVARALRPAYNRLVERTGSDSVFISDLVNESGLPLPQVQQWLRDYGINQGQATLDTGDWSVATEEQRAANVPLRGQERLYVRLHDGVGTGPAPQAQPPAALQSHPPATAATPQPQPAQRRRTGGELWRPNQRISEDAAVRIGQALHSLGVTQADIVINDTGWPEGFQRPPAPGSRQGNVIYLNREQVRGDTPLHEVVHGLIPELREKNRQLYEEGASLIMQTDFMAQMREWYQQNGYYDNDLTILEEVMTTLAGDDGAAWIRRYADSGAMSRRLQEWVAKLKVWVKDQLRAAGVNPNRNLRAFTNEVNLRILAGELRDPGTFQQEQQDPSVSDQSVQPNQGTQAQQSPPAPIVFDQHGRITEDQAELMTTAIRELGVTQARFVINGTGVEPGTPNPPRGVKGQRVTNANSDTIYLNRNEITWDTAIHEVFHGLIPELRNLRPDLFNQGVAILRNSPALREIQEQYGPLGYTEDRLMEEALATVLGNEAPSWLRNYSTSAPWVQALMRWIAKVRVWINDFLGSRDVDPNMTLREFVQDINRRVLAGQLRETGARMREAAARQGDAVTDLSILPDPYRTDLDPNTQHIAQSGLAANQPGSAVWTMAQGIHYQTESGARALEEAQRLYNEGQAQGFTFQDHYARLTQMIAAPGGVFNMTPGTYMGLMGQELSLMQADRDLHWTSRAAAAENMERLMELMASAGASGGQFIKGFDFGLRIMNDAFSQVENMSMRAAVGGEQAQLNAFKGVVRSIRAIMAQFQQEGIDNLTPEQAGAVIDRVGGRMAQGDEAAITGEVEVEETLTPEIERTESEANVTDQDWFKAGVAQLSSRVQRLVDEWLITLEALSLKTASDSDFSLTPQERSAKAAELARTMTREQLKKRSEDLFRQIGRQQKLEVNTPTGPQDVKGLVKTRLANNLNRLLNGKVKGKKTTQEQIAATIANVLLAKAGRGNTIESGPDASILAMGVILSNEQLARDSVAEIHSMLQANESTKDAISQKKLQGFMSLLAGKDFSAVNDQAAPFGERQIAGILRNELNIQNTTLSQTVRTAALQGLTVEQLEANLRDPFRGLTEAFEPAVLDRIVNAVKAEYTKSARERAESIARKREQWEAREGAVREARTFYREQQQQAATAERLAREAEERLVRQQQREGEVEQARYVREAAAESRKKRADYLRSVRRANQARARLEQAESERMAAEVRRTSVERKREQLRRDRVNRTLARRDRVRRLRNGQPVEAPAPLNYQELQSLLKLPADRILPHLTREFGLDLSDLPNIYRADTRQAALETRVKELAAQLGLNPAEAETLHQAVAAEYTQRQAQRDQREAERREQRAALEDPVREARRQAEEQKRNAQRAERLKRLHDLRRSQTRQRIAERAARRAEREGEQAFRRDRIRRMRNGEAVPDIGEISEDERRKIMSGLPRNRVIDYLSREFGFNISDLVDITRPGDRQATIEQRTLELADQLGLTREQAAEIVKTVSAEGMRTLDRKRMKEAQDQIRRAMDKLEGTSVRKAKRQPTAVERMQRLMNLGGLEMENIEKVLLNSVEAQEFTPEFKNWLRGMLERSNDPSLPQTTRDHVTMTINTAIRSAKGASLIGLLGEWTMSNIFFAVSTFKVNAFWGGVKAISDSALYARTAIPRAIRDEFGIETRGLGTALFRQAMRSYTRDLQYHAEYLFKTGRSALESDYTTRFTESEFELLAAFPDTPIRKWLNGEPVSPFWAKGIKTLAGMNKYVRRTMVGTDLLHRSQAHEMLKAGAIVRLIAEQGGQIPNTAAGWTKAIDDAMYGGDFAAAKRDAWRQADNDIAAGRAEPAQRGLLFGEYLDKKLGKSLGVSESQRRDILDQTVKRAKRWTNADQTQGVLGLISTKLMEAARDIPGVRFLLPAIRMPINAFSQGLDWSPYAYLRYRTIKQSGNRSSSFSNYLFNRDGAKKSWHMPAEGITNEQAIELRTKAHLGTSMMIVLFLAAALDWDKDDDNATFYITGRGPTDPQQAKLWKERGYRPFMIRIGGVTANYQESPAFAPLAVLGASSDANRYGKPDDATSDKLAYAITRSMAAFADAAVLRNLNDVLSGVTGSQTYNPKQAGQWTSRLAGVVIAPRIGGEINTILWGPQSTRDLSWGARALANVPFVPAITNKPAINFFGEEIHAERGMIGEVMPLVAHRISPIMTDDEQLSFVARMGAAPLETRRRFKDNIPEKGGVQVMEDYDTMRKWATASGKALRKWLTPQVMDRFRRQFGRDREQAEKDFDSAVREIRNRELMRNREVQF